MKLHFFMCIMTIFISSLEKWLFRSTAFITDVFNPHLRILFPLTFFFWERESRKEGGKGIERKLMWERHSHRLPSILAPLGQWFICNPDTCLWLGIESTILWCLDQFSNHCVTLARAPLPNFFLLRIFVVIAIVVVVI